MTCKVFTSLEVSPSALKGGYASLGVSGVTGHGFASRA